MAYYFSWLCERAVRGLFSDFIHGFIRLQIWWGWRSKVTSFTHLAVLISSRCGLSHFPNMEISERHSKWVKMKLQDFWRFGLWSCIAFIPLRSVCQAKSNNQCWFEGWGNRSHLLIISHVVKDQRDDGRNSWLYFPSTTIWYDSIYVKWNSRQTNSRSYKFLSRQAWREYEGGHLSSWMYSASSSRYWLLVCSIYENSTSYTFKISEMVCDCILELKVKIVYMYLKNRVHFLLGRGPAGQAVEAAQPLEAIWSPGFLLSCCFIILPWIVEAVTGSLHSSSWGKDAEG